MDEKETYNIPIISKIDSDDAFKIFCFAVVVGLFLMLVMISIGELMKGNPRKESFGETQQVHCQCNKHHCCRNSKCNP